MGASRGRGFASLTARLARRFGEEGLNDVFQEGTQPANASVNNKRTLVFIIV
jgi:hypothetical protein